MNFNKIQKMTLGVSHNMPEKDRETLYCYAGQVLDDGTIVDIGTAGGNSAFVMALASKSSVKVYTIDPNRNENFFFWREKLGLEEKITFIEKTSDDAIKDWKEPIDLLFIDGEHAYSFVQRDIDNWLPYLKEDGKILFHDFYLYPTGVMLAVGEAIARKKIKPIKIVNSFDRDGRAISIFVGEKWQGT